MKTHYGRRHGAKGMRVGARQLSATYGTTLNAIDSTKSGANPGFLVEMQSEQLVGQILEIDPDVAELVPQGLAVDMVDQTLLYTPAERKAALRRHRDHPVQAVWTADFSIRWRGQRCALEVKTDAYPGDADFVEALARAGRTLQRFGCMLHKLVVPSDQRKPIWSNVALIYQAAARRDLWPTPADVAAIELAGRLGAKTAGQFMAAVSRHINELPVFLAAGALRADLLAAHLTASTEAAPAYGDISHLRLLERLRSP